MSERNWTPEPWAAGTIDKQQAHIDARGGDQDLEYRQWGEMVTCWGSDDFPTQGMDKAIANRDRIVTCVNACLGAPDSIKPGAVVALASAIEAFLHNWSDETGVSSPDYESVDKARAALAMYNGEEEQ